MFGLPTAARDSLRRCKPVLEAEDRLAAGVADDDELYDTVLAATGDVGAAQDALYARKKDRLERGEKV